MKQLLHIMRQDLLLLHRNKILIVAALISLVYVMLVKGIASFMDPSKIVVLVIFNDPALLGFLFVGVMVLFERNENTLEALSVTPFKPISYFWSKTIVLAFISLVCSFAMCLALEKSIGVIHFFFAVTFCTLQFTFLGFILVARESLFTRFILKAVVWLILLSLPFFSYFGLVDGKWLFWMPTAFDLQLFDLAFGSSLNLPAVVFTYLAAAAWTFGGYLLAKKIFLNTLRA
jgi:fluoroquinolone transport system permease protein